jgi:hypothetical protein
LGYLDNLEPDPLFQLASVQFRPSTKWEVISMDFIMGLPKIVKQHDAIMVVVDKLSKETNFIPIKFTFKAIDASNVFLKEIFKLHSLPKTIISDRDDKFTSNF